MDLEIFERNIFFAPLI